MKNSLPKKKKISDTAEVLEKRSHGTSEVGVNFKGPNTRKKHRKPDEIYGDVSIPDSARKE